MVHTIREVKQRCFERLTSTECRLCAVLGQIFRQIGSNRVRHLVIEIWSRQDILKGKRLALILGDVRRSKLFA